MLDKSYLDNAGCEVLILSLREIRNSTRPNQNSVELKQLQDLFTKWKVISKHVGMEENSTLKVQRKSRSIHHNSDFSRLADTSCSDEAHD
ncbi:hypothetical protein Pcinc_019273 [Petrolisthes cinctipes]|uniref:Uncharacterized protein n=1 Tax=Petrolisthes cinctipes TaxID=88211 RepID=A0AAE1FKM4_PETCI|nr:hypothetical protein Pcinc_019273 [Petrolisthes cinctipes]